MSKEDTISHQNRVLKQIKIGKLRLEYRANERYILTVRDNAGIEFAQEFTPQQILDLLSMIQQVLIQT